MSTATAPARRLERSTTGARTGGVGTVLVFAGLSLGLAAAATLGGVPPALVPFVMALGPTVFALLFAWREGDGALRRLLAMAVRRPNRRAWYALVGASRRVGARGRRRRDRPRRPGGRRVRQGLSGDRHRPARRPDPRLRGGDRVARLRGHPPAAVDVTARGGARRSASRGPPSTSSSSCPAR